MPNYQGGHSAVEAALQAAEKPINTVILSEAKNLGSCSFNELRRSFVACGSG
jgi:succinate dehydrogenase/fumarate reductase flavoprotein subunit